MNSKRKLLMHSNLLYRIILFTLISFFLLIIQDSAFAISSKGEVRVVLDGDLQTLQYPIVIKDDELYLSIHTANAFLGNVFHYDITNRVIRSEKRQYTTQIESNRVYLPLSEIQKAYAIESTFNPENQTLLLSLPFRYDGETQNGRPHGFGTATYTNGTLYQGYFIEGLRYGEGQLTYPDGAFFTGIWREDFRHGMGLFNSTSGQRTSQLWLHNTLQHGHWQDLSKQVTKFTWDRGHYYIGMQNNGLFQGKGTLYLNTGTSLSGLWNQGFLEGQYTVIFSNGTKFYGRFSANDTNPIQGKLYRGLDLLKTYPEGDTSLPPNSLDALLTLHKIGDVLKFNEDIQTLYNRTLNQYDLQGTKIGVYIESLETGYHFTTANDLVKDPYNHIVAGKFSVGSAIKLPMTFAVLKYLEANQLPISMTFVDALSGKTLNLATVMRNAVSKSINSNFNYLVRYLGINTANQYLRENGILHSRVNGELGGADPYWSLERLKKEYGTYYVSRFTPEDFGKILRIVYDETKEGNAYMAYLNTLLLGNVYNARIPRGIGYQYPVAHKTGTYIEEGQFADVGIVYHPNHPYIIVMLMDEQQDTSKCEPFMRALSKAINAYMTTSVFVVD